MLDDLLLVLRPVDQYFVWDIIAYIIVVLGLIGLIISGDDNATIAGVFAFIFMGAVIDKTYAVGWFLEPNVCFNIGGSYRFQEKGSSCYLLLFDVYFTLLYVGALVGTGWRRFRGGSGYRLYTADVWILN